MAKRNGPFAFGRPDPSQDGFQADPMLVRMLLFFFSGGLLQFF
jgi:hypothetical protein